MKRIFRSNLFSFSFFFFIPLAKIARNKFQIWNVARYLFRRRIMKRVYIRKIAWIHLCLFSFQIRQQKCLFEFMIPPLRFLFRSKFFSWVNSIRLFVSFSFCFSEFSVFIYKEEKNYCVQLSNLNKISTEVCVKRKIRKTWKEKSASFLRRIFFSQSLV